MPYGEIILFLFAFWVLQIIFAWKQNRAVRQMIRDLQMRYQTGYLGVGYARSKFNFGPGCIVVIVSDEMLKTREVQMLKGYSVFARFKKHSKDTGRDIRVLAEDKRSKVVRSALSQAVAKILEAHTPADTVSAL